MKLSAPWITFYKKIEALFAQDDEIKTVFDEENLIVKIYVDNSRKADALSQLLPSEKEFGNVKVAVSVIPSNNEELTKAELVREGFCGNPALRFVWTSETPIGSFDYAVFQNRVVQFFNDNVGDINGNCSTLYEDIARDVFGEKSGIFFCTEANDKTVEKPLGEWP